MHHIRRLAPAFVGAALALSACAPAFQVKKYEGQNERLYQATFEQYQKGHYENAIAGFERLTLDLPARDTLLPRAHFLLGKAHYKRAEYVLAAQAFSRVAESFPSDTLADDALLWTARSYQRLWRKPELDAQYGQSALATYQLMLSLFPDSPLAADATRQTAKLNEWLATKEYENGMHYLRRKAYDSAIIYFRDVVKNYPTAAKVRDAQLRLVEAFHAIRYTEDAREACASLRQGFPQDREVREACGREPVPAATTSAPPAALPPAPPAPTAGSAAPADSPRRPDVAPAAVPAAPPTKPPVR